MRILLLAGTYGLADEGARNVSSQICERLSCKHEVLCISAADAPKLVSRIMAFKPEIVHSIHGPSPRTFMLMTVLRCICPRASFFATLTQPTTGLFRMGLILKSFRFIKLLSQATESEEFFQRLGFHTQCVPHGIDTERFKAVDPVPIPAALEQALKPDRKMLLHIGHLKPERGMDILAKLARANQKWQMVMIGSKRFPGDPQTVRMLQDAGCVIYQEFVDNLPALYCRTDAYIFPVTNPYGAIDMPLTVLEAMACNRPILSTPYKALPRFIPEGNGIYYFRTVDEACHKLDQISMGEGTGQTRSKALEFSWDNVVERLSKIYEESRNV